MDNTKAVQGVGVYAEFVRDNATTQIIIVPEGYTSDDKIVGASIIRRTVTEHSPKKQWKFSRLANVETVAVSPALLDDMKVQYADERMRYAATLFDQLLRGEWNLVKKPILVEVSKKDYDSIFVSKTPTKMIYRISQSRVALDFPADLIHTSK